MVFRNFWVIVVAQIRKLAKPTIKKLAAVFACVSDGSSVNHKIRSTVSAQSTMQVKKSLSDIFSIIAT